MAKVEIRSLTKRFGSQTVIENLSLEIEDGAFVVLVGPSGCGKSTLLRMIAGLEDVSDGDLVIDGVRANDIPPQKRDISMVFQSYALFPHLTVRQNISFGPAVRRENPEDSQRRIARASEILNLGAYMDRRPAQLSGGQRQRVAMGRAIVRDPKVFLFDEPLSNLDAKLRVQMRTEIKALHQTLKTTIVYVTHDQIEAMTMADRIVVMNGGRIEQTGTPLEIYDRPANRFVAGFIGAPAMGLIDGVYDKGASSAKLPEGTVLPLGRTALTDGARISVGIRPEALRRHPDGPIAFDVDVVEPTGPEIHVFGKAAGAELRAVFRDRDIPRPGDRLRLTVDPADIHIFDSDTGDRV